MSTDLLSFIAWYLAISIIGLIAFPLTFRLLPALADRGYAFSRTLGTLVWGYLFWLLASLHILPNDLTGLLFSITLLLILSGWALRSVGLEEIKKWWRSNYRLVIGIELLFILAFAGWTIVRAANPEATGTEKPMELAFINAILKSDTFPPHDPWLSGYAISYYYFGYVLVAMLAKITSVTGAVAFNLGISVIFALSAVGAYGLVYNLLAALSTKHETPDDQSIARFSISALLGPFFLLIVSNLEGFFHMLHNRGFFWRMNDSGELTSKFWAWLDINDLNVPPTGELSWVPSRFWWWWRASRVVQDYDLTGNPKEIIDEFPFFSYLLADLHPHVLVMPFALLAMTLSLNLLLGSSRGQLKWFQLRVNLRTIMWAAVLAVLLGIALLWAGINSLSMIKTGAGIAAAGLGLYSIFNNRSSIRERGLHLWLSSDSGTAKIGRYLHLQPADYIFSAFTLGAVAFLNTWDSLVFVALIAGSYALGRMIHARVTFTESLKEFIWLGLLVGAGGILMYFPFYLGFSSQAGGIIPNLIYATRGAHLWVMFGALLIPVAAFLIYLTTSVSDISQSKENLKRALRIALLIIALLWLFSLILGITATFIPQVGELYLSTLGAAGREALFPAVFTRRITSPGGLITLTGLLILTLALFLKIFKKSGEKNTNETLSSSSSSPLALPNAYTLLLVLLGILLVLVPDFIYLRDQFGWRINTIFKFYYQTWLLWSIGAAYGSAVLLKTLQRPWTIVFRLGLAVIVAMSLVYPIFSLWTKTNGFQPGIWTLDSTAYLENQSPDELAAINWLKDAPSGVIAEAVSPTGGSYTGYARIATHSGSPAVLGWVGHESQWRGGSAEIGSRQSDLERLFCSKDWEETKQILYQYEIRFVVIGTLERTTYAPDSITCPNGINDAKFQRYLAPVFQQGSITIYEYSLTE